MHENLNGHPYPMPSSHPIGPHGYDSRLGAVESRCSTLHSNQGEIFGLIRVIDRRVTTLEAKAPSNPSSGLPRLTAAGDFLRAVGPLLRDLSWPLLVLLAGLGMITVDPTSFPSVNIVTSGPASRE